MDKEQQQHTTKLAISPAEEKERDSVTGVAAMREINMADKGEDQTAKTDTTSTAVSADAGRIQKANRKRADSTTGGEYSDEDDDLDDSGSFTPTVGDDTVTRTEGNSSTTNKTDKYTTIRREKRLAMNRESARNRRKRKKMLIQSLEDQCTELVKSNQQFKIENDSLKSKVRTLEHELSIAQLTVRQLTSATAVVSTPIPISSQQHQGINTMMSQQQLLQLQQYQQQQQLAQQQPTATTTNLPNHSSQQLLQRQQQQLQHLANQQQQHQHLFNPLFPNAGINLQNQGYMNSSNNNISIDTSNRSYYRNQIDQPYRSTNSNSSLTGMITHQQKQHEAFDRIISTDLVSSVGIANNNNNHNTNSTGSVLGNEDNVNWSRLMQVQQQGMTNNNNTGSTASNVFSQLQPIMQAIPLSDHHPWPNDPTATNTAPISAPTTSHIESNQTIIGNAMRNTSTAENHPNTLQVLQRQQQEQQLQQLDSLSAGSNMNTLASNIDFFGNSQKSFTGTNRQDFLSHHPTNDLQNPLLPSTPLSSFTAAAENHPRRYRTSLDTISNQSTGDITIGENEKLSEPQSLEDLLHQGAIDDFLSFRSMKDHPNDSQL